MLKEMLLKEMMLKELMLKELMLMLCCSLVMRWVNLCFSCPVAAEAKEQLMRRQHLSEPSLLFIMG